MAAIGVELRVSWGIIATILAVPVYVRQGA